MTSSCPKCKRQNEHEDFLFEVLCECATRYNPFMDISAGAEEPAAVEAPLPPVWQDPPAAPNLPLVEDNAAPMVELTPEPQPEPQIDYTESQSAFAEIQTFAETGKSPEPPPKTAPAPVPASGDSILTAGDGLPGYRIVSYLPPVSANVAIAAQDPNPLRAGFEALWVQAVKAGANGVVAMRWVLSPDGQRAILSGTPVRCSKEGT